MKKKIILIIGIILIVGIFVKIFIFYDKYKMPKGVEIITGDREIEVYDKTNLYDLIQNSNVDILTEDTELDYMKVGQHKYTIEYKYKLKKYLFLQFAKVVCSSIFI